MKEGKILSESLGSFLLVQKIGLFSSIEGLGRIIGQLIWSHWQPQSDFTFKSYFTIIEEHFVAEF